MPIASIAATSNSELLGGELIVAVDTGGTKTAAWVVDAGRSDSPRLLGEARTSAGNPLSVGFENATRAIHEAIDTAKRLANCGERRVSRAVFSIAGAANREMAQRFSIWARSVALADRVAVVSDVMPILAAGTSDCCGVALIAGTGSSAFARTEDGRSNRCGGWGYLLGDEGSGFAIGRAALQHTLRTIEDGIPQLGLADMVLATLGVRTVTELTRAIYGSVDPRHTMAALAPLVAAAADQADPDAVRILNDAAAALAELAARAAKTVGLDHAGFTLAVSGGVLIHCQRLRQQLVAELARREQRCHMNVVREPLAGCVRLATASDADSLIDWHSA